LAGKRERKEKKMKIHQYKVLQEGVPFGASWIHLQVIRVTRINQEILSVWVRTPYEHLIRLDVPIERAEVILEGLEFQPLQK